jgi:protein archease
MSYRWVDHTAELELEIEALSEEAVFAEALLALAELLCEERPSGEAASLEVSLAAEDCPLLLADWLDELVFVAETEGLIPLAAERIRLDGRGLRAVVRAVRGKPSPLVKGVTHHRLTFERSAEGFRATVVIDV